MAEYRELPRMIPFIQTWVDKGCPPVEQLSYTLGKGHMKFFLNKGSWLKLRHASLVKELVEVRGYNISNTSPLVFPTTPFEQIPIFTFQHTSLNWERIREKIALRPNFYKWTNRERPACSYP